MSVKQPIAIVAPEPSLNKTKDDREKRLIHAYPPGTHVSATITLRCGTGLRDVSGYCPYDDWSEFMESILSGKPTVFGMTDDQGEIIGEEHIMDPGVVAHVSYRVFLPPTDSNKVENR